MRVYEARHPIEAWYPPCSEQLLLEVSKSLARPLPLPEEYLDFLRQWNGIVVGDYLLAVPLKDSRDVNDHGVLQLLYGIEEACGDWDIRSHLKDFAFDERVPSHILAIGSNDNWDRICISLGEETYGHIIMWQPGEPWYEEGFVQTEEYLRPVADSFSEFWDLLERFEGYD